MEDQFIYKPLDTSNANSFRILKLQPGDKDASLVCNLIQSRLDVRPRRRRRRRQPAYEAISYVWGSSDRTIPINCNGKRLYITENLRDALVRVRLPDCPRMVWADSVCIDQEDLDEKGNQVQFMGKIYSNASRVLICLGKDDEGHAQKAMSLVEDLSNMIAKTLTECEQTGDRFPYLAPDDTWHNDDRWPAHSSLASRPWFYRGWVLQEAALAQDAVILWGEVECSWSSFMDIQMWIEVRGGTFLRQKHFIPVIHILLHLSMGGHSVRLRPLILTTNYSENLNVPEFMSAAGYLRLSKPVDRVFAFLGILDKISRTALHIKADYSKTPQSVYTEFAVSYLHATHDLNLLQWIQHTNGTLELGTPSWVPLWDMKQWIIYYDVMSARQQDSLAHFTLERGSDPPRLTAQALLFDTIRFASDPLFLNTVGDIAKLWQIVSRMDESANTYRFLQALCRGRYDGDWETWELQLSAYGRHLLASPSSNLGMNTFRTSMTYPQNINCLNR